MATATKNKYCSRCGVQGPACLCWGCTNIAGYQPPRNTGPYYAVGKRVGNGWSLWWCGHNREAASAEFNLCAKYGGGRLLVFATYASYAAGLR